MKMIRPKLRSVTFNGNEAISSSKLQEQMELQPDSWWKLWGNKFDGSQFEKDIQTIQDYIKIMVTQKRK